MKRYFAASATSGILDSLYQGVTADAALSQAFDAIGSRAGGLVSAAGQLQKPGAEAGQTPAPLACTALQRAIANTSYKVLPAHRRHLPLESRV